MWGKYPQKVDYLGSQCNILAKVVYGFCSWIRNCCSPSANQTCLGLVSIMVRVSQVDNAKLACIHVGLQGARGHGLVVVA